MIKKSVVLTVLISISCLCRAQFPIVLEAENASLFGSLETASVSGFSGGKYVRNFHISDDSYYLYDNVEVAKAGTYEFKAYTTGTARPFSVKVNNYERTVLRTNDSPDWNAPPTSVISCFIYLDAGVNVIRMGSEREDGPNIDKFEINRTSSTIPQPAKVTMAYVYDFTDDAEITAEHNNATLKYLTDNDETTYYEAAGVNSTTITVDLREKKILTSMLLSAGKGIDVKDWVVEFSTNGTTWKKLTASSSKQIGMGDMTLFTYDRSASSSAYAARYYRLTATGTNAVKVAEWQLFGFPFESSSTQFPEDVTQGTTPSKQVSGTPVGFNNETLVNLFDRKINTKYCADGKSFYVQYNLDKAYKFTSYTITAANDVPERDPKLWSLSGYNPEEGWIELDERRDFRFPSRYSTMKFDINSDKEFTAFMLEVSDHVAGDKIQLASLKVFGTATGGAAVTPPSKPELTGTAKEKADQLLKLMTKSERLLYVGGLDWMYTQEIPRLGIPKIKMSDGPQGVGTWGKSTAYPVAILLASTWNEDLAQAYGGALADDCKARGVHILLGPGVNIHRAPMCGRNFEYMGEDPYLAARTSTGYIKGLQANGVMGVIKHFTANFQEYDRNYISSDIDERTLNEIYFPAFKAAVQEAKVGSVMSSYNLLNGVWTTHDRWLLTDVLRNQWGFEGILMSDWGSTHACLPAAQAGLDLEMASGERMSPDSLRYYMNKGELDMSVIDLKVRHILETVIAFGFFDKEQLDSSIPLDNPASAQTALDVAREGIVLLKNDNNILPLKKDNIKKVVVVGKNAHNYVTGGGSGRVDPIHYTSFYDGISATGAAKGIEVKYLDENNHLDDVIYTTAGSTEKGFKAEYYNNTNLEGSPNGTRVDSQVNFNFQGGTGIDGVGTGNFSVRWTGELRPAESGEYIFTLGGDDGFRLYIDGARVIDDWNPGQERYKTYKKTLNAGTNYSIKVEYYQGSGAAIVDFYYAKSGGEDQFLAQMNEADVVIACYGHDMSSEAEAGDRSFELPSAQKAFVAKVLQTTTPVVGVVTAGGNVEMQSWEPKLKGLLWAWYAGQEGGTALGEILFGDVNPSGKLPVTFEKKWADNPTYNSYYDTDGNKHVKFTEGIFVGYRGYDKSGKTPQYPFGYGMSYTTFNMSEMVVTDTQNDEAMKQVSCQIKNTGSVAGAQVIQLYVGKKEASAVERPVKELKAFKKIYLEPGESKTVTMYLNEDAFSYFDVDKTTFVVDEGRYEIGLGFSSNELILKEEVDIKNNSSIDEVTINKCELIPSAVKAGELIHISIGTSDKVNVYDITGVLKSCRENTDFISTSHLGQGMYLACISVGNKIYKSKFIVE